VLCLGTPTSGSNRSDGLLYRAEGLAPRCVADSPETQGDCSLMARYRMASTGIVRATGSTAVDMEGRVQARPYSREQAPR